LQGAGKGVKNLLVQSAAGGGFVPQKIYQFHPVGRFQLQKQDVPVELLGD
jgi:hypothetical protein